MTDRDKRRQKSNQKSKTSNNEEKNENTETNLKYARILAEMEQEKKAAKSPDKFKQIDLDDPDGKDVSKTFDENQDEDEDEDTDQEESTDASSDSDSGVSVDGVETQK